MNGVMTGGFWVEVFYMHRLHEWRPSLFHDGGGGMFVVGVYAPTSEAGVGARRTLRQQLAVMQGMAPATNLQIIAGDFNAEFGNNVVP